jgi:hypothetical protein
VGGMALLQEGFKYRGKMFNGPAPPLEQCQIIQNVLNHLHKPFENIFFSFLLIFFGNSQNLIKIKKNNLIKRHRGNKVFIH